MCAGWGVCGEGSGKMGVMGQGQNSFRGGAAGICETDSAQCNLPFQALLFTLVPCSLAIHVLALMCPVQYGPW